MARWRSFSAAMAERFGGKVYKLALDGGMTCPNRDGTLGTGGCLFCDGGSGAFAAPYRGDVAQQLEEARRRVAHKNRGGRYLAYLQSYTNTYAPLPYLERLYRAAIAPEDVVGLSVATRPDCLPDETIALLAGLGKPVWVELGLQTIHPQTARRIRRGYDLPVYDDAVRRLRAAGLDVVTHVILGLPGESPEQMVEKVRHVGRSGATGIKLQLLHVLDGTPLADEWRAVRVPELSLETYIALLETCLAVLPPDMVVHRLTGDGAKRSLLAPLWSADKKRVLNAVRAALERDDIIQGPLWAPQE